MRKGTRREGDYVGKEGEKSWLLRRERKQFLDSDRFLKVDETDEWVVFVIFIMVLSRTGA